MVVAKEVGHPFELLSISRKGQHDFSDVIAGTQRALLGHCRAKTIGETSRKNAHPFMFDTLMGTHNGTLSYQTHQTLVGKDRFGTDSESLFWEIKEFGIQEAMKKIRKPSNLHAQDAYALVWYDMTNNTINFLRNRERPLNFCFDKDRKTLFWSSEFGHLLAVTNDTIKHEDKYIYYLPEDIQYSWEIPPAGVAFGKPKTVRREGGIDPLAVQTTHGSVLKNYKGGTGHTDTTYDYCREAWFDAFTGFYQRFNQHKYLTEWANYKTGPWFDSKQKAWDELSEFQQSVRINEGRYPSDINITKKLGSGVETLCKLSDRPRLDTRPLDDSLDGLNGVTVEKKDTLSLRENSELKVMEKYFQEGNHSLDGMLPVYFSKGLKVFYHPKMNRYCTFTFKGWQTMPKSESWTRIDHEICPAWVPFTKHDIEARHFFKHVGKKEKKVTYFRGFNGDMLVRDTFEKIMEEGCLNCKRTPHWGNYVRFVDHKFFFCEFCERDTELVKSFKSGKNN